MRDQESKVDFDRNEYETPQWFFDYLDKKHHFTWDLACTAKNRKVGFKRGVDDWVSGCMVRSCDSLEQEWHTKQGWLWLNPPYGDLKKWFTKVQEEVELGAKICVLAPPVMGTHYFPKRLPNRITYLTGRLEFEYGGKTVKGMVIDGKKIQGNKYESVLYFYEPHNFLTRGRMPKVSWLDIASIPR